MLFKEKGNEVILWNALVKVDQKKLPIYNNSFRSKVSYYVMNDTVKEDYLELKILKRQGNLFQTKFAYALNESIVREGWIDMKYVGVYLRPHGSSRTYPLYEWPLENSKSHNVYNESNLMIDVMDGASIRGGLRFGFTLVSSYHSEKIIN